MSKDIIQLIIEDHNRGREMYRQYMSPNTNIKQKQLLAWQMIRESSIHSFKEEQVCGHCWRGTIEADGHHFPGTGSVCACTGRGRNVACGPEPMQH